MKTPSRTLLDITDLAMCYPNGKQALHGASLSVRAGELAVVLGSNGSGKSTLLKCVARLLTPSSGAIRVAGQDLTALSGEALRRARMALGMVSQHANLVKRRSVIANVVSGTLGRHRNPVTALGFLPRGEFTSAHALLDHVGLVHLARQRAGTLSGGQAQRVAIVRALAQRPSVLLADEPVASLDPEAAQDVMGLLRRLASEDGLAVLCVLHQPELAARYGDRIIGIQDGRILFDTPPKGMSDHHVSTLYTTQAA
ncbi:phosphonate ABC transporter ATP-binding protein [Varunaivibrio sulfuroxidans]|uniref:Phosphonate transport system ATP-binding protein n=1 Tax=Varunaivibrio sulfuroxidans TaxID=1773489 RepID=A0A4R3JG59_9PROT|nr:phosphonate ABC transporter ATP-binding protein [Varunaivibrio sulfuroxidans]TCS64283.1 phosphonate transport system ATP-binding protein [Varunaivibrio sulfuroxidans]WES31279.1 phosphonate ABC transporter ATP-binding protein [Varunaivibrio sulfuroxidans]